MIVPEFYNTLGRKLQKFHIKPGGTVRIYNCGPTVYDFAHIGNFRAFVFADTLRRALEFLGYKVIQVMNITDVGHLTSDDDLGEDKILKGLRRRQKTSGKKLTVEDVIRYYTSAFLRDIKELNLKRPTYMPRASMHVEDMIKIIKTLIDKGYAYVTKKAVYFDVSKFKDYTKLYPQALDEKIVGARAEVNVDPEKRHPADFRLWQLDQPNHLMQWDSPWGRGFPGWHIECSAMSMKYLGETLDIHTGGVDHIPVHHTNEIAQSEAATGKPFSVFWMHNEFLTVDGGKMSKSLGNFYTLTDVKKMGYSPMHLRYFYLTAKYRAKLDFSKKALDAAKQAFDKMQWYYNVARAAAVKEFLKKRGVSIMSFKKLERYFKQMYLPYIRGRRKESTSEALMSSKRFRPVKSYIEKAARAIANDLNTPEVLAIIWDVLKSQEISTKNKLKIFPIVYDVLGLKLDTAINPLERLLDEGNIEEVKRVLELLAKRDDARQRKDYQEADAAREELVKMGYNVVDTADSGSVVVPKV